MARYSERKPKADVCQRFSQQTAHAHLQKGVSSGQVIVIQMRPSRVLSLHRRVAIRILGAPAV